MIGITERFIIVLFFHLFGVDRMSIKQVGVVCYGNIVRSQILGKYLSIFLRDIGIEVYSIGTAPYGVYPDTPIRIKEVEERLRKRGINVQVKRNHWTEEGERKLRLSDIILVADGGRKRDILERLGLEVATKLYKFYEFISEEDKDFEDTYDYEERCQDHIKFDRCFDELERVARKAAAKIKQM